VVSGTALPPTIAPASSTPPTPPPVVTRRLAVIGDYGADTEAEGFVAALVRGWNPDAVLTVGDNNYGAGTAEALDQNIGKHYASFIGGYRGSLGTGSTTNRFFPALGNHDWAAGLEGHLQFFTLPGNERYYDVDFGPVHVYAVDSDPNEPDGTSPTSAQGLWLQQRLADSRACFDLVYFHHPPFSSGAHGKSPHMDWPFAAWGAEATLAGHEHDYERLEVYGIPYFVVGTGGMGLRPFPSDPLPQTKARNADVHGALLVTAASDGTITFEFWSVAGAKLDSHTIRKAC
jgi:tartrate-resistant acid phosphatase type 5